MGRKSKRASGPPAKSKNRAEKQRNRDPNRSVRKESNKKKNKRHFKKKGLSNPVKQERILEEIAENECTMEKENLIVDNEENQEVEEVDEYDETEIYKSEDIPRTKKMIKLELKKRQKKARKIDRICTNLGDLLNGVNLGPREPSIFDFHSLKLI